MSSELVTLLWSYPTAVILLELVLCIPVLIVIKQCSIYRDFPEINAKYDAFARTDMDKWTYGRGIFFGVFTFGILRYLMAWICVLLCLIVMIIFMTGASGANKSLSWFRCFLIRITMWGPTRMHLLSSGVIWISMQNRPDKCYKKYLGPDWTPKFDGAGIQIANHSSWLDIMVLLNRQVPSFVSKDSVRNYPGVGKIASAI